jgi:hypothetical protein
MHSGVRQRTRVGRRGDRHLVDLVTMEAGWPNWTHDGAWAGLTPDDGPLFLRDVSSHELYALDWDAP